MGWFGVVRGNPKSLKIAQFDRTHMISYSSLIETIRLSGTVYVIYIAFDKSSTALFCYPSCV